MCIKDSSTEHEFASWGCYLNFYFRTTFMYSLLPLPLFFYQFFLSNYAFLNILILTQFILILISCQ